MSERFVLMAVHAHPDDESIGTGGTLARYADEGHETVVVYGTRGEEGDVLNPEMDPAEIPEDITQLRMRELEAALCVLGVHRTYFLGYRDSGMAGSSSNGNSEAFANAELHEATGRLVRIFREARPHIVITYNEKGFYGHPDHIAANRVTLAALEASGDPSKYPEIPLPPWKPVKLYYTAMPRSRLLRFQRMARERGEAFNVNVDFLATPDEAVTSWIDVRPYLERKVEAIRCHRSQMGPQSFVHRMDAAAMREAFGTECFVCIRGGDERLFPEDDLFAGIRNRRSQAG